MEYTNENCICIGEVERLEGGIFRAYHCPIDGSFFWTFGNVEAGYEKRFGESAKEVVLAMRKYCDDQDMWFAAACNMVFNQR